MSEDPTNSPETASTEAGQSRSTAELETLKQSVCSFLDSLHSRSEQDIERDFAHFYERAKELQQRKMSMVGTKSETRDLLGEILFTRMRRGLRSFVTSDESHDELKCAEWVMGALLGVNTLTEFATAFDRALLEMSAPREYSFAGMADFISMEEVIQLLGSGSHVGCLSFEKPDNRIDIYIERGRVVFLDPYHLVRRILPGTGTMDYREIVEEKLHEAENRQSREGVPLFIALDEAGVFSGMDLREVMSELGSEVLYDFLMNPEAVFFSYRRVAEMPEFVQQNNLRMGITGLLLEGNKRLDEWGTILSVFPDRHEPVQPMADMYAKIGGLDLGVVEIKLLSLINGENSPCAIAELLGLPLPETYQHLVRFAREGAVVAPGGLESVRDVSLSTEESMKLAFEALDANDDQLAVNSALDKVLGDDGIFGGMDGVLDDPVPSPAPNPATKPPSKPTASIKSRGSSKLPRAIKKSQVSLDILNDPDER